MTQMQILDLFGNNMITDEGIKYMSQVKIVR
jgi:hypothetical protein